MTIFNTLLSGMVAVFIIGNLELLVAAVFWAMCGFSEQVRERKLAQASTAVRHRKPTLRS
jgi:hypothetical protein